MHPGVFHRARDPRSSATTPSGPPYALRAVDPATA
jgi:hypothetical protein